MDERMLYCVAERIVARHILYRYPAEFGKWVDGRPMTIDPVVVSESIRLPLDTVTRVLDGLKATNRAWPVESASWQVCVAARPHRGVGPI
jgi:hypothetical protein